MDKKRTIEVFSAGCSACESTIELVKDMACSSCEVTVLNMNEPDVAARAKDLGIKTVPAVVIDGQLAACCSNKGPDKDTLSAAGLGKAL